MNTISKATLVAPELIECCYSWCFIREKAVKCIYTPCIDGALSPTCKKTECIIKCKFSVHLLPVLSAVG